MRWYTLAIMGNNRAIMGPYGGTVWRCPDCNYYPGTSELPHKKCGNCGKQLEMAEPGEGVTEVRVRKTDYGFARQA